MHSRAKPTLLRMTAIGRIIILMLGIVAGSQPAGAAVASWIVFEPDSGTVFEQHDAFRKWYPASLTKLMSSYVAFQALKSGRISMDSPVTVSAHAAAQPPSKMGLKAGSQLSLEAALKIMLVKSANDIAVAVAETIGGSQAGFSDLMNATAQRLGMRDSHFVNPHGLPDDDHYTSARDMAVLIRALLHDFPQYRSYYHYGGVKVGKHLMRSANRQYLSRVRGADGLKTGYICNAGYNVAASATRGGRTIVAIVFGAASGLERAAKARQLIERGFSARRLFTRHSTVQTLVRPGKVKALPADRYCKRNHEPPLATMMKIYAGAASVTPSQAGLPGVTTAYANRTGGRLLPDAVKSSKNVETKIPRTGDKKIDWRKVMDRLIGPKRHDYDVITVSLAVADDAKPAIPIRAPTGRSAKKTVEDAFGFVLPPPAKPKVAQGDAGAAPMVLVTLPRRASDGTRTPKPRPAH